MTVGWREWVALPSLGVSRIKAKVDTGARTSALHVRHLRRFERDGTAMVGFRVFPIQDDDETWLDAEAEWVEDRRVRSSSGTETLRPVIRTRLVMGSRRWTIELTLTRRDAMGFRLLLGRQALRGRTLVDPAASFLLGPERP